MQLLIINLIAVRALSLFHLLNKKHEVENYGLYEKTKYSDYCMKN